MQKKNFVFRAQVPPHLFAISDLAYRSMLSSKYFLTYTFSTFLGTCELFHSKVTAVTIRILTKVKLKNSY